MTHPSSPPAPMTAERLEEIRRLYLLAPREPYHDAQPPWYVPAIADLLSDHAALTARVAELERERDEAMTGAKNLDEEGMDANDKLSKLAALVIDLKVGTPYGHKVKAYARHVLGDGPDPLRETLPHEQEGSESLASKELAAARGAFDLSESERQRLAGRINALESELTAARKVEDANVADVIGWLRDTASGLFSPDAHYGAQLTKAADLLARLSAALKEAERLLSHRTKDMQRWIDHHDARADAAEAKLEQADEKICQAYQIVGSLAHETNTFDVPAVQRALDYLSGDAFDANFLPWSIRALQTKDPTP